MSTSIAIDDSESDSGGSSVPANPTPKKRKLYFRAPQTEITSPVPWLRVEHITDEGILYRYIKAQIRYRRVTERPETLEDNEHFIRGADVNARAIKTIPGYQRDDYFQRVTADYVVTVGGDGVLFNTTVASSSYNPAKTWTIDNFFYKLRLERSEIPGPWIVAAMKAQLKRDRPDRTLPGLVMGLLCEGLPVFPDLSDEWEDPHRGLNSEDLKRAAGDMIDGKGSAQEYLKQRYKRLFPHGTEEEWARYLNMTAALGFYGAWQDREGNCVSTKVAFADA
mgnify:CR=1 FL=1